MFEIVSELLGTLIEWFPFLIGLDLIFYFIGKLFFGGGVK